MSENGGDLRTGSLRALGFGFLVPLLTVFGSGCVLLLSLLFIAIEKRRWNLRSLAWASPLLSLYGAWLFAYLIFGYLAFLPWDLSLSFDPWLLEHFMRFTALLLLFSIFSNAPHYRDYAIRGMAAAIPIAALVAYLQKTRVLAGVVPTQTFYWDSLGRYTSTFSDPNAAGIFLILLLPFILAKFTSEDRLGTLLYLFVLGCLLFTASLTGSRSFLLGAMLYLFLYCFNHSRKATVGLLLVGLASVALLDYLRLHQIEFYQSSLLMLPHSLRRGADSLSLLNIPETFSTRVVFWKIGLAMWQDNPLLGVGYHRFYEFAPYYSELVGSNIGAWTDNANNFYLGILAETGVFGFGLFLYVLSHLTVKRRDPQDHESSDLQPALFALSCLIILLIFGPHLVFDEVVVLSSIILAGCLSKNQKNFRAASVIVVSIAAAAGAAWKAAGSEYGFYSWEKDVEGRSFRWSMQQSSGNVECSPISDSSALLIRAANPNLPGKSLHVRIEAASAKTELRLASSEVQRLVIPCNGASEVRYWLWVGRSWIPSDFSNTLDHRHLGVQVLNNFEEVY